ncbi:hypothetical protein BJX99DRAFT_234121 [Aspergillus californicus]
MFVGWPWTIVKLALISELLSYHPALPTTTYFLQTDLALSHSLLHFPQRIGCWGHCKLKGYSRFSPRRMKLVDNIASVNQGPCHSHEWYLRLCVLQSTSHSQPHDHPLHVLDLLSGHVFITGSVS